MNSGGYLFNALRLCRSTVLRFVRSLPCIALLVVIEISASLILLSRLQSVVFKTQLSVVDGYQLESERRIYDGLNFSAATDEGICVKDFLENYSRYCLTSIVPPEKRRTWNSIGQFFGTTKAICPCLPDNLHGRVALNVTIGRAALRQKTDDTVMMMTCDRGGHSSPSSCTARQRVAIVVPFRNRHSHLEIFLRHIHPFLQRQLLLYTIFVVEQVQPTLFNKASLMNVGFNEISTRHPAIDCFIFHDVDILPEDDRNFYGCYRSPRHLAAFVDKFNYRIKYPDIFGGVTAFTRKQFTLCNGFSNEYYGWGGEDDDMWNRVKAANMTILRFPSCVSKYTMLRHDPDELNPRNHRAPIGHKYRPEVYRRDGLNSLTYDLIGYEQRQTYTWIGVSLPQPAMETTTTTRDRDRDKNRDRGRQRMI